MSFKVLLIGQGGREVALAKQISKEAEIYAYMDYKNPDLVGMSKKKKKIK